MAEEYECNLLDKTICLSNIDLDAVVENTAFMQSSQDELRELHENLVRVSYSPYILSFKYVDYNSSKIIVRNFYTLRARVLENRSLYFEEMGDFTQKMKHLLFSVLRGYNTLTKEYLEHIDGHDPNTIIFLETDKKNMFPKVFGKFRTGNHDNNFKKLSLLLMNLMEGGNISASVQSFLVFLDLDEPNFDAVYNHPALWSQGTSIRFFFGAWAYLNEEGIDEKVVTADIGPDFGEFQDWYMMLDGELLDYLNESWIHTNYSSNIYGLLQFHRNCFVHYNDRRHYEFETKSESEIEAMLAAQFPTILFRAYRFMYNYNFCFKDN